MTCETRNAIIIHHPQHDLSPPMLVHCQEEDIFCIELPQSCFIHSLYFPSSPDSNWYFACVSVFTILWIWNQNVQIHIIVFVNISQIFGVFSSKYFADIRISFLPPYCFGLTANRLQTRSALIFLNHICCATHCNADFSHISLIFIHISFKFSKPYLLCNHFLKKSLCTLLCNVHCSATHCKADVDFSHISLIFISYSQSYLLCNPL